MTYFYISVKFQFSDDQTRVMIKNGTSGDYINANYVNVSILKD